MEWRTGDLGVETVKVMARSGDPAGNVHEMPPLAMHVDNLRPAIQLDFPCVLNLGCPADIDDPGKLYSISGFGDGDPGYAIPCLSGKDCMIIANFSG